MDVGDWRYVSERDALVVLVPGRYTAINPRGSDGSPDAEMRAHVSRVLRKVPTQCPRVFLLQ